MPRQTKALDSPLFHVTSYAAVASIAEQGLRPRSGAGVFNHGGYGAHSQGRVFLAGDPGAARSWFNKVDDMLDYHAGDPPDREDGEEETWLWQSARVPVMLRVDGRWRSRAMVDPLGDRDVPGSYYVEATIPPEDIAFWSPIRRSWRPVSEWDDPGPRYGIERVDRDGAVYVKSAQDPGGFKPTKDAQYGPAWKAAPVPKKPKRIRVVWRGKSEETVREILTAINPDRGGTVWMASWYPFPTLNPDGSLNLQFLSLKAQQYGYPEGVEVAGYWHPSMDRRPVERLSTPRRSQAEPRWLPLAAVERWVSTMAQQGVSEVARSPRGFLPAYRRAGGDPSRLSDAWRRKRAGFIARHLAQAEARGERLVDAQGQPSRRHLALIAWAHSPQPRATRSPVEHLPATTVRDPIEYPAADTWRRECGDAWLYHVTSADRIPSIQEGGIQSRQGSRPSNFGGDGFDEHTRNRVFFSADLKTAQAWASYLPISDPIILRVKPDALDGKLLTDGRAQGLFPCSFYAEGVTVPPQDISVWDKAQSRWVPLSRWTDRHEKVPFWQVGVRTRRRAVKKHPPSWPTGHSPSPISRLPARQSYPQWAGPPEVPGTGPNLREVAPGLWVGSKFAAAEPPTPEGRWGLIIDMREGDPGTGRWARKYLRLRVVDGQPIPHAHLDQALHAYRQSVGPTLVHCHWGLSRSPSVAAALLIVEHGLSEAEATRRVSPYREDADPDEETWYDDVDGAVEWPRRATINSVLRWARTYRPTPS